MRMRDCRERERGLPSGGAWMVTLADLCTLLLTFFVLLLSMSSLNTRAFRASFQSALSLSGSDAGDVQDRGTVERLAQRVLSRCEGARAPEFRRLYDLHDGDGSGLDPHHPVPEPQIVWMTRDETGSHFSFVLEENLLFEGGSATLQETAPPILEAIGGFLKDSGYRAYIDGHTDDIPIHGERFPSNEELSLARATAVLSFLTGQCQVPPDRLALGAYGSSQPLIDSRSGAARAMNRRVEIIFEQIEGTSGY